MIQIILGTLSAMYTSDLEKEIKELKELNEIKSKKIISLRNQNKHLENQIRIKKETDEQLQMTKLLHELIFK